MNGFGSVFLLSVILSLAPAQDDLVDVQSIRAHERFLSSDVLQGRGSATRDEQIAAVYVGSQFESFHLWPDPQTGSFTQQIEFVQPKLDGHAKLVGSRLLLDEQADFRLMASSGKGAKGSLIRANPNDLTNLKVNGGMRYSSSSGMTPRTRSFRR